MMISRFLLFSFPNLEVHTSQALSPRLPCRPEKWDSRVRPDSGSRRWWWTWPRGCRRRTRPASPRRRRPRRAGSLRCRRFPSWTWCCAPITRYHAACTCKCRLYCQTGGTTLYSMQPRKQIICPFSLVVNSHNSGPEIWMQNCRIGIYSTYLK